MMHHPCLLEKVVVLASWKINFFINFILYDLANGKE
jgi:hypothetical protein